MLNTPPNLCQLIPICLLCGGKMAVVYDRANATVCACVECHTAVTVPARAWDIAIARGHLKP